MEILTASGITVKLRNREVLNNISFTIQDGEQWAITGPSGSGKTTLLKVLTGSQFFKGQLLFDKRDPDRRRKIIIVEQQHLFKNLSNTSNFYYQQRFNSQDADDAITVEEYLRVQSSRNSRTGGLVTDLSGLFEIDRIFSRRLIQLSNGENKRVQIIKALEQEPKFLLLDNPFTGLDVKSRKQLEEMLSKIASAGIHLIMVTSVSQLPFFITNVLSLSADGNSTATAVVPGHWNESHKHHASTFSFDEQLLEMLTLDQPENNFGFAVKMKNVNIQYGRPILKNISWEVRKGERWSLSGPNGSGKSTLLSLVNADNPQAYANEIYLFDRRRGTGETIWDIKRKTGFVSPELHLYFEKGITCFDVVASGLFDTIGLFRKINDHQLQLVSDWMQLLKIGQLQDKYLNQLSNSEQRLVLLARALVKNPPLLILDEPCQGLDDDQISLFKDIINQICIRAGKTMIYVSHHDAEIPSCVTKFLRLEDGEIVESIAYLK